MQIIAHRGASGLAPENTLKAMAKALELGASAIEIDVQAADGELWVFHDRRLERCTNGKGILTEQSRSYLEQLDAVFAGHPDVGHQHPRRAILEGPQAVSRTREHAHVEALAGQGPLEHPANRLIVIHHPDRVHDARCPPPQRTGAVSATAAES